MPTVYLRGRCSRPDDLPDVCARCGAETKHRVTRTFHWYPPWIGITILAGLLIYFVLAMVLRKSYTVAVPLCDRSQGALGQAHPAGGGRVLRTLRRRHRAGGADGHAVGSGGAAGSAGVRDGRHVLGHRRLPGLVGGTDRRPNDGDPGERDHRRRHQADESGAGIRGRLQGAGAASARPAGKRWTATTSAARAAAKRKTTGRGGATTGASRPRMRRTTARAGRGGSARRSIEAGDPWLSRRVVLRLAAFRRRPGRRRRRGEVR
jgi:hypothetical protein